MTRRPRVLFDIDGVSADFLTPCFDAIEKVTGRRYEQQGLKTWDIMESLEIGPDEAKAIYKSMEVPGLCESIPVYPGAREGIEQVRTWADVYAVTSPFGGDHWMHERDRWCMKNLGFVKKDIMHIRGETKFMVGGDALVEDKTATLKHWCEEHPAGVGVLFIRDYNEKDAWGGSFARTWDVLVSVLEHHFLRGDR